MSRNSDSPFVLPLDMIKIAFPQGTQWTELEKNPAQSAWDKPPNWAPDLFGIAAHLLEQAGAYHHLTPGNDPLGDGAYELLVTDEQRERVQVEARKWMGDALHIPDFVKSSWGKLVNCDRSVCAGLNHEKDGLPDWWLDALLLAAYADETCLHVGHSGAGRAASVATWVRTIVDGQANQTINGGHTPESRAHVRITEGPYSICLAASEDIFCVLPKGKTPDIGCTIRSLSQNLSLMPAAGVLQAGWRQVPVQSLGPPDRTPFNCLFVPYPYQIAPESFNASGGGKKWSWFHVKQDWLPRNADQEKQFLGFIEKLILQASCNDVGTGINAIIFPEFALTWDLHNKLVTFVQAKILEATERGESSCFSSIEFIISGSSTNCDEHNGNFVLTTQLVDQVDGGVKYKVAVSTSRTKHHRWQITPHQISEYMLEDGFRNDVTPPFDPAYWEKIYIPRRRIHTNQFRDQSILATMICEDLARAEPVHKYVRALGPNIIFVLLMDGCQVEQRWPARYAMGLAEDPGSAVVTLTSRALVSRSNDKRRRDEDAETTWSVGLARNPGGSPVRVNCAPTEEAVVLRFEAHQSNELTIDGRFKNTGWSWALREPTPNDAVKIPRVSENKDMLRDIVKDYVP